MSSSGRKWGKARTAAKHGPPDKGCDGAGGPSTPHCVSQAKRKCSAQDDNDMSGSTYSEPYPTSHGSGEMLQLES